ncbi:MAG: hypothetical protein JW885_09175 [Deltaproteobacteria bacterium]|nr:hypothetical protein [Candidatus Zymogenaceae bacterium]
MIPFLKEIGILNLINIALAFLTLLAVIFAGVSLYFAASSSRQAENAYKLTMETLEIFKRDYKMRFKPLKYKISINEEIQGLDEYIVVSISFINDAMLMNRVSRIEVVDFLFEDPAFPATRLYFTPKDKYEDSSIPPGQAKLIKYRFPKPVWDHSEIDKNGCLVRFSDIFGYEYSIEMSFANMGAVFEGSAICDLVDLKLDPD